MNEKTKNSKNGLNLYWVRINCCGTFVIIHDVVAESKEDAEKVAREKMITVKVGCEREYRQKTVGDIRGLKGTK